MIATLTPRPVEIRCRSARRHAEAADSLLRFRRAYPHYPVPADLLPLLRE